MHHVNRTQAHPLLLLLLTIAPSCFRFAPAGLLPPAAPAGFALGGSLALPVTTSNSVGSELICLNSFDLHQYHNKRHNTCVVRGWKQLLGCYSCCC